MLLSVAQSAPERRAIRHTRIFRIAGLTAVLLIAAAAVVYLVTRPSERRNVLRANGGAAVVVMDFAKPFPLDPPPAGWWHRKFWTRKAAALSFAVKDGVPALRFATKASASMLFRRIDIDLVAYPVLEWRWFVETPIVSDIDERKRAGDDHPARLFVTFLTTGGDRRSMEIIWGNTRLRAGQYKYIGGFPHYVANGGQANVGRWHRERIDLLKIYRTIWKDDGAVRVIDIALFCDSDETKTESVAYFADVRLKRRR